MIRRGRDGDKARSRGNLDRVSDLPWCSLEYMVVSRARVSRGIILHIEGNYFSPIWQDQIKLEI